MIVYGDGTQSRDFTFVDDIARGTLAALQCVGYEIVNLGADRPVSVLMKLITLIEGLADRLAQIHYRPAHRARPLRRRGPMCSKARRVLDWAPTTTHENGVEQCLKWYQANRNWASDIKTR